jgi:alginate O-acetyltransferase complex protein AlgI
MLFNSLDFAIFLPIVFILYWFVTQRNLKWQNALVVIASYVFYGWWDWRFLSLIVFSTLVDYAIGRQLHITESQKRRKLLLWASIIVNLGFLGFFKYYNFFVDNFVQAFSFFGHPIQPNTLHIILPVGISFYTFQTLSYTIDVYKRKLEPTKDIIAFSAFVSFFPQLVAGPIERASQLLPQFYVRRKFKFINLQFGLIRILWGLFKKVVIADRLAVLVNLVYQTPEDYGGAHFIIASVLFAFQIYCDFSGYSDIAIGTARLFGFKLMENFRSPYFSKSLGEFWRRWHISLSTWFRDYVYIPLGGSKVTTHRVYFNLMIVFVVSGFWHGAAWTFLIWGALHGSILIVEHLFKGRIALFIKSPHILVNALKVLVVFAITTFTWIFFRANTTADAFYIVNHLFDFSKPLAQNLRGMTLYLGAPLWKLFACFVLVGVLLLVEYGVNKHKISEAIIIKQKPLIRWLLYTSIVLFILLFGSFEVDQFIYFQF